MLASVLSKKNETGTAARRSPLALAPEGGDPSAWTALALRSFTAASPVSGFAVASAILKNGGRLAVVAPRRPAEKRAEGEAESQAALVEKVRSRYGRQFGAENFAILPLLPADCGSIFWLHDLAGFFAKNSAGKLFQIPTSYDQGWNSPWRKALAAKGVAISDKLSALKFETGDLLTASDDTVITTRHFLRKNGLRPGEKNAAALSALGVRRLIALPELDIDPGHVDVVACKVRDTFFVPYLDPSAIGKMRAKRDLPRLVAGLEEAKASLLKADFKVVPVPMLMPLEPFYAAYTASPINMRLVLNAGNELTALVPWPKESGGGKEAPRRWLDWCNEADYRAEISQGLKAAGVKTVTFITCDPLLKGGVHCLSAEIPGAVVDTLRA